MQCPFCDADKDRLKVIDSRTCESGKAIRRRRECMNCSKRFTTYERVDQQVRLMVIKKDGSREPFDRDKVRVGLDRACYKRPVSPEDLDRLVESVEEEILHGFDREVPTDAVGRFVSERLRRLDQVAYVRFASVYKRFKTVEELIEESQAVLDARRLEVPGQTTLPFSPGLLPTTRGTVAAANDSSGNGGEARTGGNRLPPPKRTAPKSKRTDDNDE
jgi:transcriptional repressor NrdR